MVARTHTRNSAGRLHIRKVKYLISFLHHSPSIKKKHAHASELIPIYFSLMAKCTHRLSGGKTGFPFTSLVRSKLASPHPSYNHRSLP